MSVPVMMGYIPLGTVFGFLFVQAGAQWWLAPLSSMLIYGGAVQYMMIPMLAAGMSIGTIAFATFVVNLRHVFYGLSLIHKVPHSGWKKWAMAFWLTDETYSQLTTVPANTSKNLMVWLSFFNWSWWVLGSLIGGVIGAQAKIELAGADFVLSSLFAMLLCEQFRRRTSSWPVWIALASYCVARWISVSNCLAIAIAFCTLGAVILMNYERKSAQTAATEEL